MAKLKEMQELGYGPVQPEKSSVEQIMGFVNGVQEQAQVQQKKEKEDVMEQVKLFTELRNAGYSPEDAHKKVTRTYRSTGFIERLIGGETNAFQKPTETDKAGLEAQKTKADIGKTKADTRKSVAQAGYYERGGAAGRKGLDGLSPNQIQQRIKDLRNQLGMGEEEDDVNLNSEISYLNELFNKKSGFRTAEEEEPEVPENSPTAESRKLMAGLPGGKKKVTSTTIIMTGPDGKQYKIPKQNEKRARENGFK